MKKSFYRFVIIFLLSQNTTVFAQYPWSVNSDGSFINPKDALMQNIPGRKIISLDGIWNSQVDPYGAGLQDRYGIIQDRKPVKPQYSGNNLRNTELVEHDLDVADKIQVPGDWNTQKPNLFYYEGYMWYRKTVTLNPEAGKRYFLHFGAVNYEAQVYANGVKAGRHEGGFTSFQFEVTKLLKAGENKILVNVNNIRSENKIPTNITDWWNYGGITRSVNLVEVADTYIKDYFIQLGKQKPNEIQGWVQLDGVQKKQPVTIEIPEIGIKQTIQTDTSGYATISISSTKIIKWSPENPKLYKVILSAETDKLDDKIGFRTIETSDTEILLNGKPIFLKGVSIHEEAPFRTGRCNSEEDARTLLTWAKEMGCNYVRLAHYPHNETMVRMADEMGFMVWSEIPVYWAVKFEKQDVYVLAENQLVENINRDKNRASIIIWSVANETPETEPRLVFLKRLISKTKSTDSTRLTAAAVFSKASKGLQSIEDPLAEFIDVMGCNEYIGWYTLPAEDAPRIQWTSKFNKPLIMSEFGGEAVAGLHGKPDEIWTEEYQNKIFENQVKMLENIPFLRGTSPWVLMDFRSPLRMLPKKQDFFNRKGLISDKGVKKMAYFTMKKWYDTKK